MFRDPLVVVRKRKRLWRRSRFSRRVGGWTRSGRCPRRCPGGHDHDVGRRVSSELRAHSLAILKWHMTAADDPRATHGKRQPGHLATRCSLHVRGKKPPDAVNGLSSRTALFSVCWCHIRLSFRHPNPATQRVDVVMVTIPQQLLASADVTRLSRLGTVVVW